MGLNPIKPTLLLHILTFQALPCGNSLQDAAEGLLTYIWLQRHLGKTFCTSKRILFKTYDSIN